MRLTVLGACGAWPEAGQACSGYLVEHDGFRLVVDLGHATVPRLLGRTAAEQVDAVFISHGHPDHCADLNPLLRARALRDDPPAPLRVYALPGALGAVLALDHPEMLAGAYVLREFAAGDGFDIGPFRAETRLLPHWVPAEATYVDRVPERSRLYLTSARHAGRQATDAGARHLLLTHLLPGTDPVAAGAAAGDEYDGKIGVATADLVLELP